MIFLFLLLTVEEEEAANAKSGKGKKKKASQQNTRQPAASTTRNNPSSSTRPTTSQPNTSGTQASTSSSLSNYNIPRLPYTPLITNWFSGPRGYNPYQSSNYRQTAPTVRANTPQHNTRAQLRPQNSRTNTSQSTYRANRPSSSHTAHRAPTPAHWASTRPQAPATVNRPGNQQQTRPPMPPLPTMSISMPLPSVPTPSLRNAAATDRSTPPPAYPVPPVRAHSNSSAPVRPPLGPANTDTNSHVQYQAMVNHVMYKFTLPYGSKFPVALNTGSGDLFWVTPTSLPVGLDGSIMCSVTGTTKVGAPIK